MRVSARQEEQEGDVNAAGGTPNVPKVEAWQPAPDDAPFKPPGQNPTAADGAASAVPWPEVVSAADLCANPPATPPVLIEGILHQGGTLLLAGPSKARKTYTLLDAGISISAGIPWMGRATRQAAVLYLNLELPPHLMVQRLRAICDHRGIEPPPGLLVWNLRGQLVNIGALERAVPAVFKKFSVGAAIIDPHYKVSVTSGMEENNNDHQGLLLTKMEALCGNAGAALMIGHHFAKGSAAEKNAIDRASGSGTFARWPDAFMSLTPHEAEDAMTVDFALRGFAPVAPHVVHWRYPVWERDDNLDPANLKRAGAKPKHSPEEALAKLKDGMTSAEWRKATKMTETTFRRKRDELLGRRVSERDGRFFHNA